MRSSIASMAAAGLLALGGLSRDFGAQTGFGERAARQAPQHHLNLGTRVIRGTRLRAPLRITGKPGEALVIPARSVRRNAARRDHALHAWKVAPRAVDDVGRMIVVYPFYNG
jgi:hypothetical protein